MNIKFVATVTLKDFDVKKIKEPKKNQNSVFLVTKEKIVYRLYVIILSILSIKNVQ